MFFSGGVHPEAPGPSEKRDLFLAKKTQGMKKTAPKPSVAMEVEASRHSERTVARKDYRLQKQRAPPAPARTPRAERMVEDKPSRPIESLTPALVPIPKRVVRGEMIPDATTLREQKNVFNVSYEATYQKRESPDKPKVDVSTYAMLGKLAEKMHKIKIDEPALKITRESIKVRLEPIVEKIKQVVQEPIQIYKSQMEVIRELFTILQPYQGVINTHNIAPLLKSFKVRNVTPNTIKVIERIHERLEDYDTDVIQLYEHYKNKMRSIYDKEKAYIHKLTQSQSIKRVHAFAAIETLKGDFQKNKEPTYKQTQSYNSKLSQYSSSVRAYEEYEFKLDELEDKIQAEYEDVLKSLTQTYEDAKAPYNVYVAQELLPHIGFIHDSLVTVFKVKDELMKKKTIERAQQASNVSAMMQEFDDIFANFSFKGGKSKAKKQRKPKRKY